MTMSDNGSKGSSSKGSSSSSSNSKSSHGGGTKEEEEQEEDARLLPLSSSYSYQERLLLATHTTKEEKEAEAQQSSMSTVRLESLTSWKSPSSSSHSPPFWNDNDVSLLVVLSRRHPWIQSVHMSIASSATQEFPMTASSSSMLSSSTLDAVPFLTTTTTTTSSSSNIPSSSNNSMPKGFLLQIRLKNLDIMETTSSSATTTAAAVVEALLYDMIATRLIATPLTGSVWDTIPIIQQEEEIAAETTTCSNISNTNNTATTATTPTTATVYQLWVPLADAAWSSDALEQAWRHTFPPLSLPLFNDEGRRSSSNASSTMRTTKEPLFFGWNALQWSNFLLAAGGDQNGGRTSTANDDDDDVFVVPTQKKMWWTWTSSSSSSEDGGTLVPNQHSSSSNLHFGIEYQTAATTTTMMATGKKESTKSQATSTSPEAILPKAFLGQCQRRQLGSRSMYHLLLNDGDDNHNHNSKLVPITTECDTKEGDHDAGTLQDTSVDGQQQQGAASLITPPPPLLLSYPYRVRLDHVLRRHHTNYGRFEAWMEMTPLPQTQPPSPLSSSSQEEDDGNSMMDCHFVYRQVLPSFLTPKWQSLAILDGSSSGGSQQSSSTATPSVEWIPEDQSSILYIHGNLTTTPTTPDVTTTTTSLTVLLEYEPSFLTLDDFPGDPNRGRELPPGRLSIDCRSRIPQPQLQQQEQQFHHQPATTTTQLLLYHVYSNTVLVLPPVPDMSMPFNVISLTSSVYAYIIGTLITILVRKASQRIQYKLYPHKKKKESSKVSKVIAAMKRRLQESLFRKQRKTEEKTEEDAEEDAAGAMEADGNERSTKDVVVVVGKDD